MNDGLLITMLVSGIAYGTPLLLAGLGELLAERSGVLNLGVEGMMLVGAVCAFWASNRTGLPGALALAFAVLVGTLAGALMASLHAFAAVTLRVNQIVSGLALTILGGAVGLSSYLGQLGGLAGQTGKHQFRDLDLLGLGDLPAVGPLLFDHNLLVYASWALTLAVGWYLYRTRPGLNLRAVGEDPRAADAMGVPVARYRYVHTILGGAFAGVAGAFYSLVVVPTWTDGMTAGAGWIAITLVIFSFWRPGWLLVGAYVFGVAMSVGSNLQARGVELAPELFSAIPYVMTVVALVVASSVLAHRRIGAPAALGEPYERGAK